MENILITGLSGFAGSHLAEYLLSSKAGKVFGTYLFDSSLIHIQRITNELEAVKIDLLNKDKVSDLIQASKPTTIFHLAAFTSPGDSFKDPKETFINNISIQLNLFESVREAGLTKTKILVVSSADAYGIVAPQDLPIDEQTGFMPTNPYAVSKIAQDFLGLQYFLSYNMQIIRVRPFNHIGPRQSPQFVVASFAKKIAEIEKGKVRPVLTVGNIQTKRDFTDVRDMVAAYAVIVKKGKIGEVYNIGSGVSHKIEDVLKILLSFSTAKIDIKVDDSLLRPGDAPELLCDNTKITQTTGWKPSIPFEKTLRDTLDYWRQIV